MRLSELLALSPAITTLFIELHIDCIGCSMNRFCTLKTLCRQYALDMDEVIELIEAGLGSSAQEVL